MPEGLGAGLVKRPAADDKYFAADEEKQRRIFRSSAFVRKLCCIHFAFEENLLKERK
jgi:hypothetical protein